MLRTVLALLSLASLAEAATYAAASASYADVSAAVALADNGDTVTVPAGAGTWTSALTITDCVSLIGAGAGSTTITANFTDANKAIVYFAPDTAARAADLTIRCSGFTFDMDAKANGVMVFNNNASPVTKVRIDNNTFTDGWRGSGATHRAVYIRGSVYGVADTNTLDTQRHYLDSEGTSSGPTQWDNLPVAVGASTNFYFEDNTITINSSSAVVFAGGHGGRYVARYNDITNSSGGNIFPMFDMHGNQPTTITGMMVNEIYGNDVSFGANGGRFIDQRGGTLMAFGNKVTWGADNSYVVIREEYLDSNYPVGNSYLMRATNSYYWWLRDNGNSMDIPTAINGNLISNQYEDTYDLAQNTDFWWENASYNGTTQIGIYIGSSLPANCTVGDGAWITTQDIANINNHVGVSPTTPLSGTFYKCLSTDVWTAYYTPYAYPHPLRNAPVGTLTTGTLTIGP